MNPCPCGPANRNLHAWRTARVPKAIPNLSSKVLQTDQIYFHSTGVATMEGRSGSMAEEISGLTAFESFHITPIWQQSMALLSVFRAAPLVCTGASTRTTIEPLLLFSRLRKTGLKTVINLRQKSTRSLISSTVATSQLRVFLAHLQISDALCLPSCHPIAFASSRPVHAHLLRRRNYR